MGRVYGAPPNRTHRVLWMLEEAALPYELVRLSTAQEIAASEALGRLNPNRRVPVLVDGEAVMWDSCAINLFLAERHRVLRPRSEVARAQAVQWSIWVQSEVDAGVVAALKHRVSLPEAERGERAVRASTAVLERALADRDYLLGDGFTIADRNVASVLSLAKPAGLDLSETPRVHTWLRSCFGRPAAKKVFALARAG